MSVRVHVCVCVCVFLFKFWPSNMNPFRSYVPFCFRPLPLPRPLFCLLTRTDNKQSFDSWPTAPLNLMQVCSFIWKLCTFLQQATQIATPPFSLLAWITNTLFYTHARTLDLHSKFQPPGAECMATKEEGIFVDRPTGRPTELLVAAKKALRLISIVVLWVKV